MSGGEIKGEKKVSVWSKKYVEKLKKKNLIFMQEMVRLNVFFILTS
jgi:hypothetical protein